MSIVVRTLSEQILDILRERIVSGDVPADAPIRQDALAAELGISKIPLREALARLEQDGLIVSQANRGFFVRPMSAEEAYDVFGLRLKIEPDAVGDAALAAGPSDHNLARAALAALNDAVARRTPAAGALNRAFHVALIRPSGRLVTMALVERLQAVAERYVHKHLQPKGRNERAVIEHEALFSAWSSGEQARARALAQAHIENTLNDLRTQFAQDADAAGRRGPARKQGMD